MSVIERHIYVLRYIEIYCFIVLHIVYYGINVDIDTTYLSCDFIADRVN